MDMENNTIVNPFAEKANELEKSTAILHCETCGKFLPFEPGTVRRYCSRTCRKEGRQRNHKMRRAVSKWARNGEDD